MKIITQLCVFLALFHAGHAQVLLTGFGTGDFSDFGSTGFSQTATAANFSGNDVTSIFGGVFSPKNISGAASSLLLRGTLNGINPGSNFSVELFDGFDFRTFKGNWSSFTPGVPNEIALQFHSSHPSFNLTTVQGVQVVFGGSGSALNFTFDNLAAIPEPSTYALLVGVFALAMVVYRRR